LPRWNNKLVNPDEVYRMKREAVLREAGRAFSRRGYHNTSLDEVARTLNVTKAALYNYVRDKQEILFECHKLALDLGEQALAHAEKNGGDGAQMLRLLITRYIELLTGELGSCAVLVEVDALTPRNRKHVVARRDEFQRRFADVVRRGIADGTLAPADPELAVFTFMGAINWIPRWYSPEGRLTGTEIADHVCGLLIDGMASGRRATAARKPDGEGRRAHRARTGAAS